jgi:hypothetical protein
VSTTRQVPPILGDGGEAATAEEMDYGSTRWSGTKGELTLHLRALRPAVAGEPLTVGPPGRYAVRAYRTGGDQLDAIVADDPDAVPHGTERFLVQFWPLLVCP